MRMQSLVLGSLVLQLLGACGGDDDDNIPAAVKELCESQADKGEECGFFGAGAGGSRADYLKVCEDNGAQQSKSCNPADDAVEACRKAYEAQTCDEVSNGVIPDECTIMCRSK